MKNNLKLVFILTLFMAACNNEKIYEQQPNYVSYGELPIYNGKLGVFYSPEKTVFKIWAPTAQEVKLSFYESGNEGEA